MARTPSRTKHMACLESLWDQRPEQQLSVIPLLDVVARAQGVRFSHLSCNTEPEFTYSLQLLSRLRTKGILYLAFHGRPGEIVLADQTPISLEQLAAKMRTKFRGWIIHFSSCGTINASDTQITNFLTTTQAVLVLGYSKTVDWLESAAMDLLVLQGLQAYVDLAAFWRYMQRTYPDLIERTGLLVYHL